MVDFVAYDYAVKVTLKEAAKKADLSYIRKPLVVCVAKDSKVTEPTLKVGLATKEAIEAATSSKGIHGLLMGGLSSVDLVILPSTNPKVTTSKNLVKSRLNQNFAVIVASGVTGTNAECVAACRLNGNVIFRGFTTSQEVDAKELALTDCAFIDNDPSMVAMYHAAGNLCSAQTWSNLQYSELKQFALATTAGDVAVAETLFTSRLSFYLDDTKLGRVLGFFVAGGKSIVDRFVKAEVARKIQETGVQYMSKKNPVNTEDARDALALEMRAKVFKPYEDAGLLLKGGSTVNLSESLTDEFTANGSFSMTLPVALWRLNIQLEA